MLTVLPFAVATGEAPALDPSVLPPEVGHIASTWGPWGLLALVCLSIITGMLVPRRVYADMEKQRDFWKAAWSEERSNANAARKATEQTAVAVTQALPPHPEQPPEPPSSQRGMELL